MMQILAGESVSLHLVQRLPPTRASDSRGERSKRPLLIVTQTRVSRRNKIAMRLRLARTGHSRNRSLELSLVTGDTT